MYTRNEQFMLEAINQAKKAYENGESPVGAIIVKDGKIIARGRNQKEEKLDVTSHAEIEAIKKRQRRLEPGNWKDVTCTLLWSRVQCVQELLFNQE